MPVGLSLAFATLCATSLLQKSQTWDEYLLGTGARLSVAEARFHPPLSTVIHSLPFLLWWEVPEAYWSELSGPARAQAIVSLRDDDWMLNASRLWLLPFGIALGWIAFVWARQLHGFAGGCLALAVLCFDPNVIAHARLITPDTTLACTTVLLAWRLWRLAREPTPARRGWAGGALGLMLLSKYTALLLAAILLVTDLAYRWARRDGRSPAGLLRAAAGDWLWLVAIGGVLLWAGYGFRVGPVSVSDGIALWAPAPRYLEGVLYQWAQSRQPHDFFLLGQHSTQGWWYFYAVVAVLKLPLATLLLLALRWGAGPWLGLRARADQLYLWLPALLLVVYLSLFNTLHNGFRYLLPVYTPLLVGLGALTQPAARSRGFALGLAASLAWIAFAALATWPDYLSYTSPLVGGSRQGYRYLGDSNLDWGQDLPQLAEWMRENGVERIQLAYFGTADPAHYGIDYLALPSATSALPPRRQPSDLARPPRFVARSGDQCQGIGFPAKDFYGVFHARQPVAVVGGSILVFDLEEPASRQ